MMTERRMGYPLLRRDSFSQDDIGDMNLHSDSLITGVQLRLTPTLIRVPFRSRRPCPKENQPKKRKLPKGKVVLKMSRTPLADTLETGLKVQALSLSVQQFKDFLIKGNRIQGIEIASKILMTSFLTQIFFGQKLWVKYLQANERVSDMTVYFQVELSYYEAAKNGTKMTEQKVRNCI